MQKVKIRHYDKQEDDVIEFDPLCQRGVKTRVEKRKIGEKKK